MSEAQWVLIPTYDTARAANVVALSAQAMRLGFRCAIICNSAATLGLIRARAPLGATVITQGVNLGFGGSVNYAVQSLDVAGVMVIINDDASVPDATLSALRRALEEYDAVGVGGLNHIQSLKPLSLIARYSLLTAVLSQSSRYSGPVSGSPPDRLRLLAESEKPPYACVGIQVSAFKAAGGFDPRFLLYFEDDALTHMLHRADCRVAILEAELLHKGGETSRKYPGHSLHCQASGLVRILGVAYGWPTYLATAAASIAGLARSVLVLGARTHDWRERFRLSQASVLATLRLLTNRPPQLPPY